MANLAANKFHCGENDRGWRVNLGWFLKAKNFTKALEMGGGVQAEIDRPIRHPGSPSRLPRQDRRQALVPTG
jgi:hypothetical protein